MTDRSTYQQMAAEAEAAAEANGVDPLEMSGLASLPPKCELADLQAALAQLRALTSAANLDPLDRLLLEKRAVALLKSKMIEAPGRWVAAAIGRGSDYAVGAAAQGQALAFADPEPWPEPVDGAELLDDVFAFQKRFTVLPSGAGETLAGFALLTHASNAFTTITYIALESPTPECGKTRELEVLNLLVRRPWFTLMPSTAVLFRVLEQEQPTILLDECQAIRDPEGAKNLQDILCAGYKRGGTVPRCVGDQNDVRHFSVFGPKVFALIGSLPGALATRCIRIPMRRRRRDEMVERFRPRDLALEAAKLASRARRWADDHHEALMHADPTMPPFIEDRLEEIWEPLLAVGEEAGGGWYEHLVSAASQLLGGRQDVDVGEVLLADLRTLFDERDVERLSTAVIIEHLAGMDERPWPEWSHGRPLTARGLAKLLAPFGIKPVQWRDGLQGGIRGYERQQFRDVWTRWLGPPAQGATAATSATANPLNDLDVALVADVAGTGEEVRSGDGAGPGPALEADVPPPEDS